MTSLHAAATLEREPAPTGHTDALPRIARLATSVPSTTYDQPAMLRLLGLAGDPFAEGIFARCGVQRRQLAMPSQRWSETLQARTAQTESILTALATEAVDRLAVDPRRIDVVVSGTYYSLGGPTLAHQLVEHCGLDPATDKYHVLGVGCASAVPLLRLATQALHGRPRDRQALVVAAECCSGFLTTCGPDAAKVKVVGSSLFGDGCAAALVSLGDEAGEDALGTGGRDEHGAAGGPAILASTVHQVPGTLDAVRFELEADDSRLNMSRALPVIAANDLRGLVDDFLLRCGGLTRADVDHWVAHPGGRGILDGLQAGLELSDADVAASAAVLAQFGNVGTPSALFVLEQVQRLRSPQAGERGLMVTIGPGVTIGLALVQW